MKILWLINIPLPEASELLNEDIIPFGGWLVNVAKQVSQNEHVELDIAFPKMGVENIMKIKGENINYYAFMPVKNKQASLLSKNKNLDEVISLTNPDLVHIFGTEFSHTLAMLNICRDRNVPVTVSIQGLVSIIAKHYTLGLPIAVQRGSTFRDFIRNDNIKRQKNKFVKKGEFEIEAIQKMDHVIGRTTLDRAFTLQINPKLNYYFCNESLRDSFYLYQWDMRNIEKKSIFVSQGSYPIKGLHFMLEALGIVLKKFPNAKLYIGGDDITKSNTYKKKIKMSSYGRYIRKLIRDNNLQQNVVFTGLLSEGEMCQRLLKSNVFVCPSTIENSPNSLGEAMLLGIPCVASNVGGIPDLLRHNVEGFLYQSDAPYMLAFYINEILSSENIAKEFSANSRSRAQETHNREANTNRLLDIYNTILDS